MTQEEWVEKKREERPSEFAPPPSYTAVNSASTVTFKEHKKTLFFTSKKMKHEHEQDFKNPLALAQHNDNSDGDYDDDECGPSISEWNKQKQSVESSGTKYLNDEEAASGHIQIRQDLSDAISAGLNYLRQQADIKQKKKEKGLLDII